jgi:hypothetical protein
MPLTSVTQVEFLGLPAEQGRGVVYRVESESELAAMLPGVLAMVRERVLPFFGEYRDVARVNRGLNPERLSESFRWCGLRIAERSTQQTSRIAQ